MTQASEYSDHELIQAWLGGDQRAFGVLYERYKRPLYGYLHRMVKNDPALVDDLFQQLWLRVIRKLPKYQDQARFGAWVFRIARNLVIDHYRSQGRRPAALALEAEEVPEFPHGGPMPHQVLERRELGQRLQRAVEDLPELQREVFIWRQNDLSFREIAELQACPLNTALARMQYALKYLKKRLMNWESTEENHEKDADT